MAISPPSGRVSPRFDLLRYEPPIEPQPLSVIAVTSAAPGPTMGRRTTFQSSAVAAAALIEEARGHPSDIMPPPRAAASGHDVGLAMASASSRAAPTIELLLDEETGPCELPGASHLYGASFVRLSDAPRPSVVTDALHSFRAPKRPRSSVPRDSVGRTRRAGPANSHGGGGLALPLRADGKLYKARWRTRRGRRTLIYARKTYQGGDAHELWNMIKAYHVAHDTTPPSTLSTTQGRAQLSSLPSSNGEARQQVRQARKRQRTTRRTANIESDDGGDRCDMSEARSADTTDPSTDDGFVVRESQITTSCSSSSSGSSVDSSDAASIHEEHHWRSTRRQAATRGVQAPAAPPQPKVSRPVAPMIRRPYLEDSDDEPLVHRLLATAPRPQRTSPIHTQPVAVFGRQGPSGPPVPQPSQASAIQIMMRSSVPAGVRALPLQRTPTLPRLRPQLQQQNGERPNRYEEDISQELFDAETEIEGGYVYRL